MPASYWIDLSREIVFSRGWGALTDAEVLSHAETLRADAKFDPEFQQIIDYSEVTEVRVTTSGVAAVAERNPFRVGARRAVVVGSDEAFGMVRMFQMRTDSDPEQFAIFRSLGPAMEWVGMSASTLWPAQPPDAIFSIR